MKQSTRFLYRVYRDGINGFDVGPRRHYIEAFGPAVKCKTKKQALALEKKLNEILKAHDCEERAGGKEK